MTDLRAPERAPEPAPRPPRPGRRPSGAKPSGGGLFRAVWRWHFFASFVVVPVLLVLAVTGLIYLFRFQLEPLLHPDLMKAEPSATQQLAQPYSAQLAAVRSAYPDATVVSLAEPREEGRSTVFSVVMPDGEGRDVFVDPFAVEVLGSMDPDTTLSGTAVRLHADLMAGRVGDAVMELGACWAARPSTAGPFGALGSPPPVAARRGGCRRGCRPPGAARLRTALDRLLGWEGAGAGDEPGLLDVEHRPRRGLRPRLDAGRVAAAQPRPGGALGAAQVRGAALRGARAAGARGQRRERRHGRRRRRA